MTAAKQKPAPSTTTGRPAGATRPTLRPDVAALASAVRGFTTTNGRTPTFDETCTLMGWTPEEGRRKLAAIRPVLSPKQTPAPTSPHPPAPPAAAAAAARTKTPRRSPATATPSASTAVSPATRPRSTPTSAGTGAASKAPANTTTKPKAKSKTKSRSKAAPPPPPPPPPPVVGPIPIPIPAQRARRGAWEWLVAHGEAPTEAGVAGRVRAVREAKAGAARRKEKDRVVIDAAIAEGPAARRWVDTYRTTNGVGPLWKELAVGMGWTGRRWRLRTPIIQALRHHGYVNFDDGVERSLDIGPLTSDNHQTTPTTPADQADQTAPAPTAPAPTAPADQTAPADPAPDDIRAAVEEDTAGR